MRVLWLGHNLAYPPKGGVLQRNYNLLREAAKQCEVHVLAFDQPATRPAGESPQECVRALAEFCTSVQWLPLARSISGMNRYWLALQGLPSHDPFVVHWLRSHEMAQRLQEALEITRFDVVHFDTLGLAQYRPLVRSAGTVLNHHNIESIMMKRRAANEVNILRRHYYRRNAAKLCKAEQRWCPLFEVNLLVSREEEDMLTESVPGITTAVIHNGVDTVFFEPRPDPGGRTLLFCGGLDWYPNRKGMEFFFRTIWPRLTARIRNIEVYVVGAAPPRWLQQLSASDTRVHVPGFVDDVRPYFQKATAYICPISDGGGTRLKILDALAMGVPVIATSFACSGLSLKSCKEVMVGHTSEEFVYLIEQVLSNVTLRKNLVSAGRETVERVYSWGVIGKSLIEAYEKAYRTRLAAKTA